MFIVFANLNRNTLVLHWGREGRPQKRMIYHFFSISNVLFASCSVAITCECIKHSQQILIASIKAHIIKTLLTEK